MAVPNFSSEQARWAGDAWFHLDLPRHLYQFPLESLKRLLRDTGFAPVSDHHFSLRQNPFGWIQSAQNRRASLPRKRFVHPAPATPRRRIAPLRHGDPLEAARVGGRPGALGLVALPARCLAAGRRDGARGRPPHQRRAGVTDAKGRERPLPPALPRDVAALAFGALLALLAGIYAPALSGPFVSDDFGYFVAHPYTASLDLENAGAILDPTGPAKFFTGNYAPVHLAWVASLRALFGGTTLGPHLGNLLLHAINAGLLAWLFVRAGIAPVVAGGAALLFAVHPAQVEAVAWISQSKTLLCFACSLAAWLLFERRPGWATLGFALALGAKAQALFLLPTLAAWCACRRGLETRWLRWWVVWAILTLAYSVPAIAAYQELGRVEVPLYDDLLVRGATMLSVWARYGAMALTSCGVAAFQEPPSSGAGDPWAWAGLVLGIAIGVRCLQQLAVRRVEGVFWLAALAAFAPVSQLFPFLHPIADRYLYFLLPGLLGGAALASGPALRGRWVVAVTLLVSVGFAGRSYERARLWTDETRLLVDAARAWPAGSSAHLLAARTAAQRGEVTQALSRLEAATRGEHLSFSTLAADPGLAPLRAEPGFDALLDALALRRIERARERPPLSQPGWWALAAAHRQRQEAAAARSALERAAAMEGPWDPRIRAALEDLAADSDDPREGGPGS